jgi:hypothetical protein
LLIRLALWYPVFVPRVDVFASYLAFVGGTDTHAGRAVTTGISWPLDFRR